MLPKYLKLHIMFDVATLMFLSTMSRTRLIRGDPPADGRGGGRGGGGAELEEGHRHRCHDVCTLKYLTVPLRSYCFSKLLLGLRI